MPPSEENLLQNTLWPETQKLYGHGNEVYAMACSPDRTVLASACKVRLEKVVAQAAWLSVPIPVPVRMTSFSSGLPVLQ